MILNTNVNQWKNITTVTDWFKNVADKKHCSFIQFDLENFKPSILLKLFNEAIQYAKTITEIPDRDNAIIKDSRKTLLFRNNHLREKKSEDHDFDVLIGCYNGVEVCELVGIFVFNKLSNIIDKNSSFYRINNSLHRYDGLGVFE